MTLKRSSVEGTVSAPRYSEAFADAHGDERLHGRYFTYKTDAGLVAGCAISVTFTIDRPAKDVWPYFKDFSLWQKDHYYSGVVGDLEGKTFSLSDKPNDAELPHYYRVIRVIPEHLIVIHQPIPETDIPGMPGLGGISPGFGVFILNEYDGKTAITILMEHSSYASRTQDMSEEDALAPWREIMSDAQMKLRDLFIPDLKQLVYEGR